MTAAFTFDQVACGLKTLTTFDVYFAAVAAISFPYSRYLAVAPWVAPTITATFGPPAAWATGAATGANAPMTASSAATSGKASLRKRRGLRWRAPAPDATGRG